MKKTMGTTGLDVPKAHLRPVPLVSEGRPFSTVAISNSLSRLRRDHRRFRLVLGMRKEGQEGTSETTKPRSQVPGGILDRHVYNMYTIG